MASYSYNRKTIDKLNVRGVLDEDLSKIQCTDREGNTFEVTISQCLEHFAKENIALSITISKDIDLLEENQSEDDDSTEPVDSMDPTEDENI